MIINDDHLIILYGLRSYVNELLCLQLAPNLTKNIFRLLHNFLARSSWALCYFWLAQEIYWLPSPAMQPQCTA